MIIYFQLPVISRAADSYAHIECKQSVILESQSKIITIIQSTKTKCMDDCLTCLLCEIVLYNCLFSYFSKGHPNSCVDLVGMIHI